MSHKEFFKCIISSLSVKSIKIGGRYVFVAFRIFFIVVNFLIVVVAELALPLKKLSLI